MSLQLESRHFFREGDTVRHYRGATGRVVEAMALYAVVRWEDGPEEEVEQLDPAVTVIERAERG